MTFRSGMIYLSGCYDSTLIYFIFFNLNLVFALLRCACKIKAQQLHV